MHNRFLDAEEKLSMNSRCFLEKLFLSFKFFFGFSNSKRLYVCLTSVLKLTSPVQLLSIISPSSLMILEHSTNKQLTWSTVRSGNNGKSIMQWSLKGQ